MKATSVVNISKNGITLNNAPILTELVTNDETLPFVSIYKALGLKYPKFYKMDKLCKLGFLGVEILKQTIDFSVFGDDRVALLLQNSFSSLDTDSVHQKTINEAEKPTSPAVFVYTLPNIVMGEIAIRNKFYGENLFTLADVFSVTQFEDLVNVQFQLNKADAVIGGWIELFENDFNLRLYFLDKSDDKAQYEIV